MAVIITIPEVKELQPTNLSDDIIQYMIDSIDEANTCLDNNNVSDSTQKLLKLYGVCHQILMADDGGEAKSMRGQSGASRTLNIKDSDGINSTRWGKLVKQMDKYGCITNILDNSDGWLFAAAIGPDNYEQER